MPHMHKYQAIQGMAGWPSSAVEKMGWTFCRIIER